MHPTTSLENQSRDKEAGLSLCNQIRSLPGPQLSTGNLKFSTSLQFPNPSLQSPWAFLLDLAVSAWQTGLAWLAASSAKFSVLEGSEGSLDVLILEKPWQTLPFWKIPSFHLFNDTRSLLSNYFFHLSFFFGGGWGKWGILFWLQTGKFEKSSLNQTYGEPHSDWLFKTISIWLSQWLQHKSDLLSVTNDLSRESLIQIPDDSKQHLSKSSSSTLEPTTIPTLLLGPSELTTSCVPHMCAHTRLIDLHMYLCHL